MAKKAGSGSEGANGKTKKKASVSKKKTTKKRVTKKTVMAADKEPEPEVDSEATEAAEVVSPAAAEPPKVPEPEPTVEAAAAEAAPAPPPAFATPDDVGEIETVEGMSGILGAMGGWLWSAPRRPWTIAVGAALLLIIGLQFGGEEPETPAATEPEATTPVGEQSLSEEARLQVAAGDPLGAARRLEPEVTRTDRKGGDAHLHAALAHAYAQAGWGADAVPHFEWTARKDPSALQDDDLRDLIRLLGLPGSTPEGVQATLISAGRRGVPFLEAVWEDEEAPVLVRRRAGEVLQRLGEDISLVESYQSLLERGACPARKEAVARLAAATDDKAVELLEEVAESGRCGAAEARRALGQ